LFSSFAPRFCNFLRLLAICFLVSFASASPGDARGGMPWTLLSLMQRLD
jgi:hypothetical protein